MINNLILKKIDGLTMYQTVIWSLQAIVVTAFTFSFTDKIFYSPVDMIVSFLVIVLSSFIFHKIFAFIFKAPANIQSTYITALILFLILDPTSSIEGLGALAVAAFFGVATKYVLAINKLHVLNPAAIATVLASLLGLTYATWWVGNPYLLPIVLVSGLIVTYKIRRFDLVIPGILSALFFSVISAGYISVENIYSFFAVWPILFFAFFMLTEPLSTPGQKNERVFYGALAGGLSSLSYSFGPFYSSPELALVIANIIVFAVMLKGRVVAPLIKKEEIAKDTFEFTFKKPKFLRFKSGQYLEWSLPHKNPDSRGISRYFTIASSPTEEHVKLGVKIGENRSTFKQKMLDLKEGENIYAASLSGDFLLPSKKDDREVVFIAGGIGVTPFRSMIKDLVDNNQPKNLKMFLCNKDSDSIAYKGIWEEAEKLIGAKVIHVLDDASGIERAESGRLNADVLSRHGVKNKNTVFYISGPTAMVNAYKKMLIKYGVTKTNIHTDYFPGLA